MSEEYRIPRRQIMAQVTLVSEPPRDLLLFVGLHAASHDGFERPSDVLNGRDSYVPARDAQNTMRLLNLDSILVVTVAAKDESVLGSVEFQASEASCMDVVVALEGGLRLRGYVRYVLPHGQQRLQNYLRLPERFLSLYDGPRVHLINRRRVIWVECLSADAKNASTDSPSTASLPQL